MGKAYPNIFQAILLLILLVALSFVLLVVLEFFSGIFNLPLKGHPAAMAVMNLLAYVVVVWIGIRKAGRPAGSVLPFLPVNTALLFPLAITVIGANVILSEVDNLFRFFFPQPEWLVDVLLFKFPEKSLWGSVLLICVVAPLTEESLFRGLLLRGFLRRYTPWMAAVASALLFALVHLNPWQFLSAFFLGLVFAWWIVRTGSLVPAVFGHVLNNSLPFLYRGLHVEVPAYTEITPGVYFQPLWLDLTGLIMTAVGIWLLVRFFGHAGDEPGNYKLTGLHPGL